MFRNLITDTALVAVLAAWFAAPGLAQTCPTPTPLTSGTSVVASVDPAL
jgi:hypothetical protein